MTAIASLTNQIRPSDTNPAPAISPVNVTQELTKIVICNTSGASATFRMFHSTSPAVTNESTALFWDREVTPGIPVILNAASEDAGFTISPNEVLSVSSSVADALTFTFYGVSQDAQGINSVRR